MTLRSLYTLVALAWCAVAVCSPSTQARSSADDPWGIRTSEEIRALLAQRMAHNGVGVVVGVIEPAGRRVIAHGRSGAPDDRLLDGDSLFQIGSVTKVFTGLLLADMVQRGEVGLEDPAAKYLPSGVSMPQRGRPITLIDLSKHWSGLPSMPSNFVLAAEPNPYEAYTAEQLYQFLSSYELPREPGTQHYSNVGVALLGRLLARRAGMEYETLLHDRVLQPLGLADTRITLTADQKRRAVPGHDRFLDPVETWYLKAMPASGSLWSTANDLLRFLAFHLGEQDSPLRPAMLLQRVPGRALGWGASRLGGETVYGHEGGKEGYRSAVVFNPRTRTGIVVLTNARTSDSPMELARHLLFRGSPLGPASAAPARPRLVTLPPAVLDAYAGEYRLESQQRLRIARKDDQLLMNIAGEGVVVLAATGARDFVARVMDVQVSFERHDDGAAGGLVLRTAGRDERAVRVDSR